MKEEFSSGVILFRINTSNKEVLYLLLHYPRGYWDLVKGKVESNETPQETALRELKEETGLSAKLIGDFEQSLTYYFKSPTGELIHKTVSFFVAETNQENVTISEEHIGYRWLTLSEALKQLTYNNAQRIMRRADHYIQYYLEYKKESKAK
jgi:8-oxo-dGTP pyrophosphatase MutT (NUDIX family)